MQPKEIKRLQRGARRMEVRKIAPKTFIINSRSNPHAQHIVTVEVERDGSLRGRCTCPWAQNGGYGCTHVMAALTYMAERKERAVSFWASRADAERQRHRILRLAGDRTPHDHGLWITTRPLRGPNDDDTPVRQNTTERDLLPKQLQLMPLS